VYPERDAAIRRGDFSNLLSWLRSEVHQYGRKYQPQQLVQRAAGSKIDPGPYLRYLRDKFGEIYGIG
jgi:carboxypeptidase Taq